MRDSDRRFLKYRQDVEQATPEAPDTEWACPQCGTLRPAGVAFCTHPDKPQTQSDLDLPAPRLELVEEEVFSQDMRPRLRRK